MAAAGAPLSDPLLRKRRFDFAHFHLRNFAAKLDSAGRDRGLELFGLRFELRFIFVGPDPNKFVLWPIHQGADDGTPGAISFSRPTTANDSPLTGPGHL